jgi:formyl-CoA transferase/CoA:oxalate CoA-transferase
MKQSMDNSGENSQMPGPLAGIKVLDLTQYVSGPYSTMMLADLGAEVIKVERPKTGDVYRQQGPDFLNGESTTFLSLNRNKKSLTLNLKDPRGTEIAAKLARQVDVFFENFKPGTIERLGLGYKTLSALNPRLVYCSISGYGQTGPLREKGGYDLMVQGLGGLMSVTGEPNGNPVKAGLPVFDFGTGLMAVVGVLAALLAAEQTGKGQYIDVSLFDCSISWLTVVAMGYSATGKVPGRRGTASHTFAPYQAYKARDGYVTVIGTGGKDSWGQLCKTLGLEELIDDPRFSTNSKRLENLTELSTSIEEVLQTEDVTHWVEKLEQAGLACGPINSLDQALAEPQVVAREMIQRIDHTAAGMLEVVGVPIKLSETPGGVRDAPPLLGEHTNEIMSLLGYSQDEMDSLRDDGVI